MAYRDMKNMEKKKDTSNLNHILISSGEAPCGMCEEYTTSLIQMEDLFKVSGQNSLFRFEPAFLLAMWVGWYRVDC